MAKLTHFNLREHIVRKIVANGGWSNVHAHIDRAYTMTQENFGMYQAPLRAKWDLVDHMKRESSVDDITDRMSRAIEMMLAQGVTTLGTFIDVDSVIEDKAIKAASIVRERYKSDIAIKFINQVLKGVLDPKAREWFDIGAEFVDIIGGLPGKDIGHEEAHIEILLEAGKRMGKMVHVHTDQLNTASEKETELLAHKTIEFGMEGRVVAIHGISIAAHHKAYRDSLYELLKKADMTIVSCPTAWIDNSRTEELAPTHNAITPVDELVKAGVRVAIGTDNINDLFVPHIDGDMWTELRLMLAACRFTDIDELVKIATTNGRIAIGLI